MRQEQRLTLELCKLVNPNKKRIQEILEKPLDYPFVLGQLLYNRMGAAAYQTLNECNLLGDVNREFRNVLMAIYQSDYKKTESFIECVDQTGRMLEEADFPYVLLKGAYLASIYPKGTRTSNDIDLLIRPKDITKLSALLSAHGFQQGYLRNRTFVPATRMKIIQCRMNRGETVPFVKKAALPEMEYCEIDINFSIGATPYQKTEITEAMLENRRRLIQNRIPTLAPVDFFIHLCVHLFKEATVINWVKMGNDLSLYKFCDLYVLIGQWLDEEFLKALEKRVDAFGLQRECYFALRFMEELFQPHSGLLQELLEVIKPSDTAYLKEIIDLSENKTYYHEKSFSEWLFCGRRMEHLHERTG